MAKVLANYQSLTFITNLSKNLFQFIFQFILQNWTSEFEQTLLELRMAVLQINSTCLAVILDLFGHLLFQRMGGGWIVWHGCLLRTGVSPMNGVQTQNPK